MEENTARINEVEEIEPADEVVEAPEDNNAGAFVAGIVGGFLAYAFVSGAKKLAAIISTKLEARKHRESGNVIDADFVEAESEQPASEEETQNK